MSQQTILILDDDAAVGEALSSLLRSRYELILCTSVQDAEAALESREYQIDLLVLDYQIGKDNGLDFFKDRLLDQGHQIPSILISCFSKLLKSRLMY
jgi:DNA-binding NtrC family response regulator